MNLIHKDSRKRRKERSIDGNLYTSGKAQNFITTSNGNCLFRKVPKINKRYQNFTFWYQNTSLSVEITMMLEITGKYWTKKPTELKYKANIIWKAFTPNYNGSGTNVAFQSN